MRNRYDSVASKIRETFESSSFWRELVARLRDYGEEYLLATAYPLFTAPQPPTVLTKRFAAFLQKTFRRNVLENDGWPAAPPNGWVLPDNWYARVGDIVRTSLVVKYLDGVDFMTDRIMSLCREHALECEVSLEAREEGYYAAHVAVAQRVEVPRPDWDTEKLDATVEIQVTTQLQDVIRILLHRYYEARRERRAQPDVKWQWDYKSDEFLANYLGHILHYAEGMIMEVRDRQSVSGSAEAASARTGE